MNFRQIQRLIKPAHIAEGIVMIDTDVRLSVVSIETAATTNLQENHQHTHKLKLLKLVLWSCTPYGQETATTNG